MIKDVDVRAIHEQVSNKTFYDCFLWEVIKSRALYEILS